MNNEKVHNHFTFYETYAQRQIASIPYNTGLAYNNGQYEAANVIPWDHPGPNSTASTPGPSSSESSSNSPHHGQIPNDGSVESLIYNLLRAVNAESFSSPPESTLSPAFSPNYSSGPNSHECNDPKCEICQRIRSIRSHNASYFLNQSGSWQSPAALQLTVTKPVSAYSCQFHRDATQFYCETCSRILCSICDAHLHYQHIMVHLAEAISNAGTQAQQVLDDANVNLSSFRQDLYAVKMARENLDLTTHRARIDIMTCIRKIILALQSREAQLLENVEQAYAQRSATLCERGEGLKIAMERLIEAVRRIDAIITSTHFIQHPINIVKIKDMVSREIFQILQNYKNLPPGDESWISFKGIESSIIDYLYKVGSIIENHPGPNVNRRPVRGRGGSSKPWHSNKGSSRLSRVPPAPPRLQLPPDDIMVKVPSDSKTSIPNAYAIIGAEGSQNALCRPWGVTCDYDGHIIIADRSNDRIQIYKEDGTFVRKFGESGDDILQFNRPAGIVVDNRKRIIVVDKDNHRVQIASMEGTFLMTFGKKGARCGEFNYPWDVAVNAACQIVVTDTRNHRIQLFSAEGVFLRKFGYEANPNMWKSFDSPRGIAFKPDGTIVTADFNNHRIIHIDRELLSMSEVKCDTGESRIALHRPQGLVVDDKGNMIVADCRNNRVVVFDANGDLIWSFDSFNVRNGKMIRPSGITLTPSGRIAVVDFGNNRVLIS